jgi:hypothetical protein
METILPATAMDWLILTVTILAYGILIAGIFQKKGMKSQSFFTNLLWAILDVLVYIAAFEEQSSSLMLVFGCILGSLTVSILLLKYDKKKKWTKDESITLLIVCLVVFLWLYSGSNLLGLTLAVIAEIIAGWPQMKKSWKKPGSRLTLLSYFLFLIVYSLSIYNSPDWQLKNVIFPIAFFVYCIGDTLPLIIKWWKIERRNKLIKSI